MPIGVLWVSRRPHSSVVSHLPHNSMGRYSVRLGGPVLLYSGDRISLDDASRRRTALASGHRNDTILHVQYDGCAPVDD